MNPINIPIIKKTMCPFIETNTVRFKINIMKCFTKVSTIALRYGVASLSGINILKLIVREFPHNSAIKICILKPPILLMIYYTAKDNKYKFLKDE